MIKTHRFISLLLAVAVLIPLLAGCTGSSADYCVKVEGDAVSIPSMNLSFSFPAPWFVITDEEAAAIAQDVKLLHNYVDEEGNLLCSQPEAYTTEEIFLLNGKTLETCRISVKEDRNEYSLENFAFGLFDKMQDEMSEISLPQVWSIGKYKGYAISTIPQDSNAHLKHYYLHDKNTFVEIITAGSSDHVKAEEIIEGAN